MRATGNSRSDALLGVELGCNLPIGISPLPRKIRIADRTVRQRMMAQRIAIAKHTYLPG